MLNAKQIVNKAVKSAHISGVQALSKEQFDALFLSARGMGAVKQKYHDDPLGLQSGLMQEDIFDLIGIPLNAEYLKQKKALQKKYFADKDNLKPKKLAKKEKEYLAAIETLRNEFKVDAFIAERIQVMVDNPSQYARKRDEFSMHLSMDFIEDDIDIKVKKAHESDAEFALKQKINKLIHGTKGEPSEYGKLRKNFLSARQKIEDQHQLEIEKLRQTIAAPVAKVNSQSEPALEENRKKQKALVDHFPTAAIENNNVLRLETVRKRYAQAISEWRIKPTTELAKEIERLVVENEVLVLLKQDQHKYGPMDGKKRSEAMCSVLLSRLETEQNELLSRKQQEIMACEAPIQAQLQELEERRVEALAKCKHDHASELKVADKYFDENILPLVKELKTQEAHKYFVVLSKKMKSILVDNVAELEQVDSNTIGFVGLFNELLSDLTILGAVQHIGVKTAQTFIETQVQTSKPIDEGIAQRLVEEAAEKVSKKIGKALSESVGAKDVFSQHVAHMEQYARVQVPKQLAEEFDADSFTNFLPRQEVVTASKEEDRIPDSIFDVIEQFNQSKGVLDKLDTAKNVYKAITTAKPGSTFFTETPGNNAQVFVKALEDEALAFNYKMLEQFSGAIETLHAERALNQMVNEDEWVGLSTQAKKLQEEKASLDKEFTALCRLHQEKRKAYKLAQAPFDVAKQTLADFVAERQLLAEKLEQEKAAAFQAQEELYAKELPPEKRAEITAALTALDEKHVETSLANDQWYSQEKRALEDEHEVRKAEADQQYNKQLVAYDEGTEKGVHRILERGYANAKTFNIGILASKKDLQKYRQNHREIEEVIKQFRIERESGKPVLAQSRDDAKISSEQQLESDISSLVLKLGKKKLDAQRERDNAKAKILSSQAKVDKRVDKIQRQQKKLEAKLAVLDEKIEAHKEQVDQREQVLLGISREFYTAVSEFNEHKTNLNKQSQKLLGQVFALDANGEPHLRALQTMFAGAHKKMAVIAVASEQLLPSIVDGVSTQTMTYDDVASKVMGRRDVKEVMQTADEHGLADKATDNVIQFGAKSIVEGVSGQAVKVATAFVDGLAQTVQAEQKFSARQSEVNARAQALGLNVAEQKPEIKEVVLDPKKKGLLSSIFKAIGGVFKSIRDAFTGTKQEREEERARFDEVAAEDIKVTPGKPEPTARKSLTFAAKQFAERSGQLGAKQTDQSAEAAVDATVSTPTDAKQKKSTKRRSGR